VNNRLMVYPVQIFLFVGFIYLVLCTALDRVATYWLTRSGQAAHASVRSAVQPVPGE
jgi:polar amino acid transport system permease protein